MPYNVDAVCNFSFDSHEIFYICFRPLGVKSCNRKIWCYSLSHDEAFVSTSSGCLFCPISLLNLTSEAARLSLCQPAALQAARQCAQLTKDNKKPLHTLETMHTPIQIKHTTKKDINIYTSLQCKHN